MIWNNLQDNYSGFFKKSLSRETKRVGCLLWTELCIPKPIHMLERGKTLAGLEGIQKNK